MEAVCKLSACPVTTMDAACELSTCSVMAMKTICELPHCLVMVKETIYVLSSCPRLAMDATNELSIHLVTVATATVNLFVPFVAVMPDPPWGSSIPFALLWWSSALS